MSEENQILSITIDDVNRIELALTGNSIRNMRRALEKISRRLVIFERRLIELRSNESIIKARIYNNADAIYIDRNYLSGKTQKTDPQQSYHRSYDLSTDPHQNYSYNRFNIHTTGIGVQEMDSVLSAIDSEIKAIQAELNKYEKLKEKIVKAIEDAEAQKKRSLKKTLGQILPPTSADLEQDKIARSRTANILLLYKIALNYRDLSYLPDTEKRVYPDERKLPRQLKVLRQIFWSHAQSPGLEFDKKDELTYDDPANSKNLIILKDAVDQTWYTSRNTKVSLDIDQYLRDIESITADPLVSYGIERRPDSSLPVSESLSEKRKSYPTSVLRLGDSYYGSFEIPSFLDCIEKWWKKKNADLYLGLPQCPDVVEPYPTTGDEKEEVYKATRSTAIVEAGRNYILTLAEAEGYINEEKEKNLGDLPNSAPDWVRTYVEAYGNRSRGSLDYYDQQVTVLRGTSTNSEAKAIENANKLVSFNSTAVQMGSYSYQSIIGYLITFSNGSQQYVYPQDKEAFDAQSRSISVSNVEEQYEYVGYVLWIPVNS